MREDLEEGVDYYIDNGLWVFTDNYLLKRGYCCESGCRHCPYGYHKKIKELKDKKDKFKFKFTK